MMGTLYYFRVMYVLLFWCNNNGQEWFCVELHARKCHTNYSDVHQITSADELFEAYQSTTDPDLFQVYILGTCKMRCLYMFG